MQKQPSPYQAYLDQTQIGESQWWSWLIGFWFIIVLWFYGQIFLSGGMAIIAIITDSNLYDLLTNNEGPPTSNLMNILAFLLAAPILPIILWFLKSSFQNKLSQTIAITISTLILICTAIGFVILNKNTPGDSQDIVTAMIQSHPLQYALVLLSFPVALVGMWMVQKFVHKRTITSLHTAAKKFRWKRMFFAMVIIWVMAALASVISHFSGLNRIVFVFDASRFWSYFFVTLLFIPLQSATEEIALRGYLNQGLGRYIKNPWIVFFITSAAFAALHLGNPEVAESTKDTSLLIAISGYFFFGMFACILTYIDGGLETAIGMHAANNMFAACILGYDNSALPTPTIFKNSLNTAHDSLIVIISLSIVCYIMYKTRTPLTKTEN